MPSEDDGVELTSLDLAEVDRVMDFTTARCEAVIMRVDPDDGPVEDGVRQLVGLELSVAPADVPLDGTTTLHLVMTTSQARTLSADLVGILLEIAKAMRHG